MKKKHLISSVRVVDPCTEEWNKMVGGDRVRFCTHCAKDVTDLSTMTEREAMSLVRESGGRLCIRYIEHPETRAPMFAEHLVHISRRAPRMAAGVIAASMSLSTLAYAQGGGELQRKAAVARAGAERSTPLATPTASPELPAPHGSIWGTITDENDAVIPAASVALLDKDGKELAQATTGYDGVYRLEQVPTGRYQLVATAAHFRKQIAFFGVTDADKRIETLRLAVEPNIVTMGVVAISSTITTLVEPLNPLTIAVADEDTDEVRDLIAAGEDVDRANPDGSTPLFVAVRSGNLEIVRLLIDFGADVNARNDAEETALMLLDEDSPLEMVELLIRRGARLDSVAEDGDTALIRAANGAKPEVLQALIDAGAALDVRNKLGITALMNAANDDDLENVRVLLLAGADVNIRDEDGDNAWDYAADEDVENLLVSHGVELDPEDLEGHVDDDTETDDEPEDN
jgi:hypothetical protein